MGPGIVSLLEFGDHTDSVTRVVRVDADVSLDQPQQPSDVLTLLVTLAGCVHKETVTVPNARLLQAQPTTSVVTLLREPCDFKPGVGKNGQDIIGVTGPTPITFTAGRRNGIC